MGSQFSMFFNDFHQKSNVEHPKVFSENDMLDLGVREKKFCSPSDASDGFEKLVWELWYPQK